MRDTRQRLIDAAIETVRVDGIAGVSARTVAARLGASQGLVFYHFGTVHGLLSEACVVTTRARVAAFEERLAAVEDLRGLLDLGRDLHDQERDLGNVAVLAQMLAGAQTEPALAEATRSALALWIQPIERTLERLVRDSPVRDLLEIPALARAVSAGFVGLELYEGVDPEGAASALDMLTRLAVLMDVLDDLGPVARRALKARLRRSQPQKRS